MRKVFILLTTALIASSCSEQVRTAIINSSNPEINYSYALVKKPAPINPKIDEEEKALERPILESLTSQNYKYFNLITNYINFFANYNKKGLENALQRASYYSPIILPILKKYNLPSFLIYLPIIESGYNPNAVSSAGAVGIWQLMPQTARDYNLIVNNYVDQRKDIVLSTIAAAKYLRDLYNRFHNWDLVLAAYNCGEKCVSFRTELSKTDNFWEIISLFPQETQNYVPKFLALLDVLKAPSLYGINTDYPSFDGKIYVYKTSSWQSLNDISKSYKVQEAVLKEFNNHILNNEVPPDTYIYIPKIKQSVSVPKGGALIVSKDGSTYFLR